MLNANLLLALGLVTSFVFVPNKSLDAQGANAPYPVYDTKTVTQHGPYLLNPTQSGLTICFYTAGESAAKIEYWKSGEEDSKQMAQGQKYGLVPVGRMHSIRLENLSPGTAYKYKVVSRRVLNLRPYWPEMGKWTESPTYSFTTFSNSNSKSVSFSLITDTHEHVDWIRNFMKIIDWDKTDFLVDDGDIVDYAQNRQQLFASAITPLTSALRHSKPLLYVRGNHENRGQFARKLFKYLPPKEEGKYYYAGDNGPLHFIVLDTGEDKDDTTGVYAGLNNFEAYRREEYAWLKEHIENSASLKSAPFKVILMHQPQWGFTGGENEKWTALANKANINIILAGHWHRFGWFKPGEFHGNKYYLLVLGQRQVENVTVSDKFMNIEVKNDEDKVIFSAKLDTKGALKESYMAPELKESQDKMLQRMNSAKK